MVDDALEVNYFVGQSGEAVEAEGATTSCYIAEVNIVNGAAGQVPGAFCARVTLEKVYCIVSSLLSLGGVQLSSVQADGVFRSVRVLKELVKIGVVSEL